MSRWRSGPVLGYALMILVAVVTLLLVLSGGEKWSTADAVAVPAEGNSGAHDLFHVLLALAVVIVVGRALGWVFRYLKQPPVIGEVMAGIALGPSLLGQVAPEVSAFILPPTAGPLLGAIAQLGVVLYMFLVGLELNPGQLRERGRAAVVIAHAGIALPFTLGAFLALVLYPRLSSSQVPFTSFTLFLGVALSVTAFPVLARILTDQRMTRTELGVMALTCAAIGDVTAWCLLAFVVGVAQAQVDGAVIVVILTLAYLVFMFVIVRPLAAWLAQRYEGDDPSQGLVALVFVALLASALATELIGIHAIFGAFLLGAVFPHEGALAHDLTRKLEDVVTVILLPAFFAFTGMRTQIGLVSGLEQWLLCGLIIVVATVGKLGGALAAARLTGLGWRSATALGVLMNTRGLMELIVLNVGLDLKVISPTLFAMMVLMALATTMMTAPLLQWVTPDRAQSPLRGLEATVMSRAAE